MNESLPRSIDSSACLEHRPAKVIALVVVLAVATSCGKSSATPPVTSITACPAGAVLEGTAPPAGLRQRCQKSETERHGASREWYEGGKQRSYSEWWEGKKHGRFTLWYKNGGMRAEGAHRHGAPAGRWKYYREDGSVSEDQTFPASPPADDWLARAIAGQPPSAEEMAAAAASAAASGGAASTPDLDH